MCVLCGSPVWPSPPVVVVGPLWSVGPSPLCAVWVPCVGPLCGSPVAPVWVPSVWVPCVGPLCGSLVALRPSGIYSRDVSRSLFTRSRSTRTTRRGAKDDDQSTPTKHLITPPPTTAAASTARSSSHRNGDTPAAPKRRVYRARRRTAPTDLAHSWATQSSPPPEGGPGPGGQSKGTWTLVLARPHATRR